MKRDSFLGSSTESLKCYDWQVTGLGRCQVAFGLCRESGLVMQTESVTQEQMNQFYANTATYVSSDGKPTPAKVHDLERLIRTVKEQAASWPERVLQVGSSDGYTLSRYRAAGSKLVRGVDPSPLSREFASRTYGVETIVDTIETIALKERFDHIVLTHVLEHLYDPRICLEKCQTALEEQGSILVEVPLWEWMEYQPLGVLTFEHLNYFCEETLVQLLRSTGFSPVFIGKYAKENNYPVITIFAQKQVFREKHKWLTGEFLYHRNRHRLAMFLEREASLWEKARLNFLDQVRSEAPIYIYGAGIHTAQLLAHSVIGEFPDVAGIFDSSPTKWGKRLGEWLIQPGETVSDLPTGANVVVSSYASERAISEYLLRQPNRLNVIQLHKESARRGEL